MDGPIHVLCGLLILASGCSPSASATSADAPERLGAPPRDSPSPIVVELFSSEGCSSCPPADTVLRRLSTTQPIPAARVIALEFHVDYWNYLGWSDPFSSATHTTRQQAYGRAFGQRGAYTPQMVIDGTVELVGSHEDAARAGIERAAREPKARVELSRQGDRIQVTVTGVPDVVHEPADVWLAVTEEGLETAVPRGENAGATLAHGPVVRRIERLGPVSGADGTVSTTKKVDVDAAWRRDRLHAVAFVQRRETMRIVGAAEIDMR